jgi:hypothetical protein
VKSQCKKNCTGRGNLPGLTTALKIDIRVASLASPAQRTDNYTMHHSDAPSVSLHSDGAYFTGIKKYALCFTVFDLAVLNPD